MEGEKQARVWLVLECGQRSPHYENDTSNKWARESWGCLRNSIPREGLSNENPNSNIVSSLFEENRMKMVVENEITEVTYGHDPAMPPMGTYPKQMKSFAREIFALPCLLQH